MAIDAQVLREFLISLGFKVDENKSRQFFDHIALATLRVAQLAAAAEAAAVTVVAAVSQMADGLNDLYWASQRTNAAAQNLLTLSQAASTVGSSVGGMRSAIESFAMFLRSSPGAAGLVSALGVNPNQDPTQALTQLGARFRQMPQYLAIARAQQMGIGFRELQAIENPDLQRNQGVFNEQLRRAHVNLTQATDDAHKLTNELTFLGSAFYVLRIKVNEALSQRVTQDIQHFREFLENNFERIAAAIEFVAHAFLSAMDVVEKMADTVGWAFNGLIAGFQSLPPEVQRVIEIVGALGAAWVLLNSSFVASPLGRALLFGGLFLTILSDYRAFREQMPHIIPWEQWQPDVDNAITALGHIGAALEHIVDLVVGPNGIETALSKFSESVSRWGPGLAERLAKAVFPILRLGEVLHQIASVLEWIDNKTTGAPIPPDTRPKDGPSWWDLNVKPWFSWGGGGGGAPGGGGGSKPGPPSAPVQERAKTFMQRFMQDLGLSPEGAAAMVGMGYVESGLRSIPAEHDPPGTAHPGFGIWQDTGDRRVARDAFGAAHPGMSNEEVDYQYTLSELRSPQFRALLEHLRDPRYDIDAQANAAFPFESGGSALMERDRPGHVAAARDMAALLPRGGSGDGGGGATLNQQTTINISGVSDARTAAGLVLGGHEDATRNAIRTAQGAVR
jgi:hypothetical protein